MVPLSSLESFAQNEYIHWDNAQQMPVTDMTRYAPNTVVTNLYWSAGHLIPALCVPGRCHRSCKNSLAQPPYRYQLQPLDR